MGGRQSPISDRAAPEPRPGRRGKSPRPTAGTSLSPHPAPQPRVHGDRRGSAGPASHLPDAVPEPPEFSALWPPPPPRPASLDSGGVPALPGDCPVGQAASRAPAVLRRPLSAAGGAAAGPTCPALAGRPSCARRGFGAPGAAYWIGVLCQTWPEPGVGGDTKVAVRPSPGDEGTAGQVGRCGWEVQDDLQVKGGQGLWQEAQLSGAPGSCQEGWLGMDRREWDFPSEEGTWDLERHDLGGQVTLSRP